MRAASIIGSRLLQGFPEVQSLSFPVGRLYAGARRSLSTSAKAPEFNILFFCPRNEEHFQSFDKEYSSHVDSLLISDFLMLLKSFNFEEFSVFLNIFANIHCYTNLLLLKIIKI